MKLLHMKMVLFSLDTRRFVLVHICLTLSLFNKVAPLQYVEVENSEKDGIFHFYLFLQNNAGMLERC